MPTVPLGNSDEVRVGDVVLAIGNPLGIGQTVTSGIISAKGRTTGLSDGSFEDFLQTDAAINRGNSGGALVDSHGRLIGINSQIISPSGGNIGIGFAIPVDMARNVMDQLVSSGMVHRGQLGVVVQMVTADIAESLGMDEAHGVIVNDVSPGSAADDADLERGDVITEFNGEPVDEPNVLRNMVASTRPGTEVKLKILRDGDQKSLTVELQELQSKGTHASATPGNSRNDASGKLGLSVTPLTPDRAQQFGLSPNTTGVIVAQVDPSGPAADAGVQRGDVITEVNRRAVSSAADLKKALDDAGDRPLLLLVSRQGQTMFLTVRPNA
jgi:Do/DeqQ family serine protease